MERTHRPNKAIQAKRFKTHSAPQFPAQNPAKTIEDIANRLLHLETLETRRSDGLDFSDQAVWAIKEALEAAFQAVVEVGRGSPSLPND